MYKTYQKHLYAYLIRKFFYKYDIKIFLIKIKTFFKNMFISVS